MFFHSVLALLKRAARGEMLEDNEMVFVWKMDVTVDTDVMTRALSFFSHFEADADLFAKGSEYLGIRKKQAWALIPEIEIAKQEYL